MTCIKKNDAIIAIATVAHLKIWRMGPKPEENKDTGVNHKATGNKI